MSSKTFSGRADEEKLQLADAIAQRDAGMSFGRFCSTHVIDYVCAHGTLPALDAEHPNEDAFATLRSLSLAHGTGSNSNAGDPSIALLSDSQIDDMIAGRYA